MRTILCTVGTSIAQGCTSLPRYFKAHHPWSADASDLAAEIQTRLEQPKYDLTSGEGRIAASAELNSLQRLGVLPDDEIVLLTTDTAEGRTCAEALARAITTAFALSASQCRIEQILDLQVRDAERLRGSGLPNLCRKLLVFLRDPSRRYGGGVIINPTGGYKGIVPFTTILGMLHGARVVYVFESSPCLISLPPLPVVFDLDLFEMARPALLEARQAGIFPPERFLNQIPVLEASQRDRFLGFLEVSGNQACLSPLAEILLEEEEQQSGRVFLSPDCLKKLEGEPGTRPHVIDMLARTGSATWRAANPHAFATTDLRVFGNGQFPLRVAGFLHGGDFYVCEFFYQDHNLYERRLEGRNRRDYPATEAFTPLPIASKSEPSLSPETWADLKAATEKLAGQLRTANATLESRNAKLHELREENQRLVKRLADAARIRPVQKRVPKSGSVVDGIPAAARPIEPFSCEGRLVKIRPKSLLYSGTLNGAPISIAVINSATGIPADSATLTVKGFSGQEYWGTIRESPPSS